MLTFAKSNDIVRVAHARYDTLATAFICRYSGIAHILYSSSASQWLAFGNQKTDHDPT